MLSFKQMRNRVYDGKTCVRFECDIPVADDDITDENVTIFFTRYDKVPDGQETWKCRIVMDATHIKDSDVYNFAYSMPKRGMPLETVAAFGLRCFQSYVKQEVQKLSNIDFAIGSMLEGM